MTDRIKERRGGVTAGGDYTHNLFSSELETTVMGSSIEIDRN